jgi:hypothetical protein
MAASVARNLEPGEVENTVDTVVVFTEMEADLEASRAIFKIQVAVVLQELVEETDSKNMMNMMREQLQLQGNDRPIQLHLLRGGSTQNGPPRSQNRPKRKSQRLIYSPLTTLCPPLHPSQRPLPQVEPMTMISMTSNQRRHQYKHQHHLSPQSLLQCQLLALPPNTPLPNLFLLRRQPICLIWLDFHPFHQHPVRTQRLSITRHSHRQQYHNKPDLLRQLHIKAPNQITSRRSKPPLPR